MKGSFTTRKGALYCIVMTCLCSLLATGCASKYGAQTTDVHYYPDCYQPIADLRSAEKSFNTTMVMGTTMGALLGEVHILQHLPRPAWALGVSDDKVCRERRVALGDMADANFVHNASSFLSGSGAGVSI